MWKSFSPPSPLPPPRAPLCVLPLFLLLWFILLCGAVHAEVLRVVYPANEAPGDARFADLIEILHTALERTAAEDGPFELQPSAMEMNEARYLSALKQGQLINIAWSSTSIDKERDLLPLRIPLRKGLLGYRIALIAREQQARIDQIHSLDDLRRFSVGQGLGWGDVKLYQAAGIKVAQASYDKLFRMLTLGRFDLFPRGVTEVYAEYALRAPDDPRLTVEKNLLLYYPWPYYFFFNRKDDALKQRVESGIRMMLRDGSFDALFWKYNGKAIEQANLRGRRVIALPNTMLPRETPLGETGLWLDPTKQLP
ncbi:ABC transporter substrate-binding protein [Rugamonas sp. DEMB1]|uniref:substrate-binding periplasmic protein n=1 Tax=Rugamonas sp. DEMB1 TaxID=3039386 RepID=UPI00244B3C7A|nr:transporter substrate-binding domain-containing protein [Rugamonas sp. DEMB1]WGG52090.1 transporter substrate-binding domain-containing protein [Rugamonas sp. DEMB1]